MRIPDAEDVFKALGNPTRLRVVRLLLDRRIKCAVEPGEDCAEDPARCDVGEILAELDVQASTLTHHLKELEHAGLIERGRSGRHRYCRVRQEQLERLVAFLGFHDGLASTVTSRRGGPHG